MLIALGGAEALTAKALTNAGFNSNDAAVIVDHLMDCELRGLGFGGLDRALSIIERLQATTTPRRATRLVRETPLSATLDGADEVGYLVANQATDLALAKTRQSGLAVVGANQTWYTGMFSYYLERITREGFVGLAAGSGGQIVAPHGATEARFGTNPIAFGFPTGGDPVIWDIGTAEIMLAEVLLAHRLEQELPEGVAFDSAGQPTRTPMDVLGGALTVWGGHRGSGLALVVQLLGMLAGASAAPEGLTDCGFLLIAIDPDLLTSGDDYRRRVAEYAESVRAARPIEPETPVRMPFDRSVAERRRRRVAGHIEVPDEVHTQLQLLASAGSSHTASPTEAS